jgi:sugar phosphate permease
MVASVLPVYLLVQLGLSPLAFGALDGLSHGVTTLTRWGSGFVADRWHQHKEVAAVGYALSAACRLALIPVQSHLPGLAAVIAIDRLGKGIRTAPRDALIALSTPAPSLGQAFGVHRALDAAGAMLGPFCAFAILAMVPTRFDVVFVTACCVAVIGLGVLTLFVQNVSPATRAGPAQVSSLQAALPVIGHPQFRTILTIASLLSVFTIGDAFVYLALRDRVAFPPHLFPLLFVGTSAGYLILAVPAGRLSDRYGRLRVFLAGHLALVAVYALLLRPSSSAAGIVLILALLGGYYAATDGVMAALASSLLPQEVRGSGLALVATTTSLGRVAAAVLFGWCWSVLGRQAAVIVFMTAMAGSIIAARTMLPRRDRLI